MHCDARSVGVQGLSLRNTVPATIVTRPFTEGERLEFRRILDAIPGRLGKAKLALSSTFLSWAVSLLGAVVF